MAGFTKETSFDGYTSADTWQVQAVNENGGLSQKSTANITTGISLQSTPITDHPSPIFNLAGQKVGKDYKGLVIKNGKKMIQ